MDKIFVKLGLYQLRHDNLALDELGPLESQIQLQGPLNKVSITRYQDVPCKHSNEMLFNYSFKLMQLTPPGGISILGGRGRLVPKFASEIRVGAPNFASKNIGDKYPKFCPLNFRYNSKCLDSFPTFASCGNRTSQVFPLIW